MTKVLDSPQVDSVLDMIDRQTYTIKHIRPSDWNEKYRTMDSDSTPYPGPFSYDKTPFWREIVNRFSPYDPAKKVVVQKGTQLGYSTAALEAGIGYLIDVNPCNILFLMGHEELAKEAMKRKIEPLLDSTGLRSLIKPNTKRSNRTGDTSQEKEFPGGVLTVGYAGNHKLLRQRSTPVIIVDDFDAAKSFTKESGDTTEMISFRQAAYYQKMKLFMGGTPELKEASNIEPAFLAGDQRYYFVPCPLCGDFITFEWEISIDEFEKAGITWKTDEDGNVIEDSVGYICQKCGNFFDESHKYEMNLHGEWHPTSEKKEPGYFSYHINSLYAPPGMYDWTKYVRQYLEAFPPGQDRNERKAQTFMNLVLGKTYEEQGEEPQANQLQKNVRDYNIIEVPDLLSQKDGNGHIVLITCAADLNGKIDDARIDYEIVGWSEKGASYSIDQGSIGTFIPREYELKEAPDRIKWTYQANKEYSVWPEFEKILAMDFETDDGSRIMPIFFTGIDAPSHFAQQAYSFIENTEYQVIGLKGKDWDKYVPPGKDVPYFKPAQERNDLYLVEVNKIKDDLALKMRLNWNPNQDESQPSGFMNFPTPSEGKYNYNNFFSHFESEVRKVKTTSGGDVKMRWEKKNSAVQNHFWDVNVYNMALREIIVFLAFRNHKGAAKYTWSDFVKYLLGK